MKSWWIPELNKDDGLTAGRSTRLFLGLAVGGAVAGLAILILMMVGIEAVF